MDFIRIIKCLISNVLGSYFEISQIFFRTLPKFNVKFLKNFLNLSSIVFRNSIIFLEFS